MVVLSTLPPGMLCVVLQPLIQRCLLYTFKTLVFFNPYQREEKESGKNFMRKHFYAMHFDISFKDTCKQSKPERDELGFS